MRARWLSEEFVARCPRLEALRLLAAKYSPDYRETAEKYIAGSFGRTEVLRLDIEHVTGKGKRIETK